MLADSLGRILLILLFQGACSIAPVDQYLEPMVSPIIIGLESFVSGLADIAEKGEFDLPRILL